MMTFYRVYLATGPNPLFPTRAEAAAFAAQHNGLVLRDYSVSLATHCIAGAQHLRGFDQGQRSMGANPEYNSTVETLEAVALRLAVSLWPDIADGL